MRRLLLIALLALVAAAVPALAGPDAGVVRVYFSDAAGLREGSLVRVDGAGVGKVRALRVDGRSVAEAELELDDAALPLGAGASAQIRAANLLGEKFVDLTVGDRAHPLRQPVIPLERTGTPVEIDDVIDVLDPTTRGRLALLMGEAGIALNRRGSDVAAALPRLPRTVHDVTLLLEDVTADTRVLERLVTQADRVADSVAGEHESLGRLVHEAAEALEAPASKRRQLAAGLKAAPGALAQLRTTLRRLDRAGAALRPAARGLRATAPALDATLQALPGFAADAAPALSALRASAPALTRLGREGAPVVRRLRPTAASLRDLAADADAMTGVLDSSAADLLATAEGWAHAIQGRDAVSHLFRVSLSLTPDALRHLNGYIRAARRRTPQRPLRRPGRPGHPGAHTLPRLPEAPKIPDVVRGVVEGLPQVDVAPNATDRIEPLIDFLLGP